MVGLVVLKVCQECSGHCATESTPKPNWIKSFPFTVIFKCAIYNNLLYGLNSWRNWLQTTLMLLVHLGRLNKGWDWLDPTLNGCRFPISMSTFGQVWRMLALQRPLLHNDDYYICPYYRVKRHNIGYKSNWIYFLESDIEYSITVFVPDISIVQHFLNT